MGAQAVRDDPAKFDERYGERELLDFIGPEIEREQFRRQLRNFVVFVALVIGVTVVAYGLWKYAFGSPVI